MLILAIETSGETASAAVVTEGKVLAEINFCVKSTHSRTLMPMIDFMLGTAGIELAGVDFVALGAGPGSFTGLRIGAATAKALCHGADKKLIPVPTLDALAYNAAGRRGGLTVPVMDARRGQVYSCAYENIDNGVKKLAEYAADDLENVLAAAAGLGADRGDRDVVFTGDAANVFYDRIVAFDKNFRIAQEHLRLQRAASVGILALGMTDLAAGYDINPVIYLRKPQAEREREETGGGE